MTQYTSPIFYKEGIIEQTGLNPLDFENKKEMVYERGYKVNVLVIYATLSIREETDQKIKLFKIRNGTNGRYISFRGTDSNNRVRCLYLSNMTNV